MKLLFLLIVGVVLYFIAKNYKTEKFENINITSARAEKLTDFIKINGEYAF